MSRAPSFDDFFRAEQAGLVRYAALLSGSTAQGEDIVQDVLVRMYLRWEQLTVLDTGLLAYARRAVTNEHVSWRRRWATRHIHPAGDELPDVAVPAAHPDGPDEQLWQRLQALPVRQRAALVLRFYEDLPDAGIAAALDCRVGTVRSLISRGLAALRIDPVGRAATGADAPDAAGPTTSGRDSGR